MVRRNGYVIEQLSFVPGMIRRLKREQPDVILFSDCNMAMRLLKFRNRTGATFKLIYSNGAPLSPPFQGIDHVQQVAPPYLEEALAAGEPASKHSLVPYGFTVPDGDPISDPGDKAAIRKMLNLPADRPIILSVGWISEVHKRMGYTIEEIGRMPEPRPFLLMLGAMDQNTPPVIRLADEILGAANYAARSVPYEQVDRYYQAADIFVLSSLKEGFGRVYIEALIHGLPVVAHPHPVMRYVLGEGGTFGDLSKPGVLAELLAGLLRTPSTPADMRRRRQSVRDRLSWPRLAPAYAEMFRRAAGLQ
jgi:glycosyltransferase involved in cell wall biosynthesis